MTNPGQDPLTKEALQQTEIFEGLDERQASLLCTIARPRSLRAEEYLFLLGDSADRLFIVLSGKVDLCFPLSFGKTLRDVCVEAKSPGEALGWSALVKPYRFTLSARAAEPTKLAAFVRQDLQKTFDADPGIGSAFMRRISEVIGHRLLKMQALWARELQRTVAAGMGPERDSRASGEEK